MKLDDLNNKNYANKALKENFDMGLNVDSMSFSKTKNMKAKVGKLIAEARNTPAFHKSQENPSYLKLLFLEQALNNHLRNFKQPRIVLENEEVEKSQVILAAQDMVDTIQKMYEDVNDMLVKELPALVDSIQSEIGANESDQFSQSASGALTTLNSTLQETKNGLQNALNTITGQGSMDAFGGEQVDISGEEELNMEPEMEPELGGEETPELPPVPEEPGSDLGNAVGRAKR